MRPALPGSVEELFHDVALPRFFLPLRGAGEALGELREPLLERAIGVVYRPQTELASHYFQAVLPRQFDEYCWFDRTSAVRPLDTTRIKGMPETYPFGL